MRGASCIGRLPIVVLVMSLGLTAPVRSAEINDLDDAKTAPRGNLFLGGGAGSSLTIGNENTGVGADALHSNRTGFRNTASGASALQFNTSGSFNTGTGAYVLQMNSKGSFNTASGYAALLFNTTGRSNTASGFAALHTNTSGRSNTASGYRALGRNSTGHENVAVGHSAGGMNTTGSRNVFIGRNAGNNSLHSTRSNQLVIANTTTAKPLIAGNFRAGTLTINGVLSSDRIREVSDARLKTDIAPLVNGLSSVVQLKAKTYEWRADGDSDRVMPEGRAIGLIAQEVEEVLPELVSEGEDGYKGIEYSKLTAVLVEAIKEQQLQIEALRSRVDALERQ